MQVDFSPVLDAIADNKAGWKGMLCYRWHYRVRITGKIGLRCTTCMRFCWYITGMYTVYMYTDRKSRGGG